MIVTEHFVYIHTSRTAGTFLNRLIREHVPGARMLQYHGHLRDLPEEYSHLPVNSFQISNTGYYSWLFQLMYETDRHHDIHIGRFENVREEALRLFEEFGTPITNGIRSYLKENNAMNSSRRPRSYVEGFEPELEQLVAEKDKYLIDRFGYQFSESK
jgi:hypothetical protein